MYRKITYILILVTLLSFLAACGGDSKESAGGDNNTSLTVTPDANKDTQGENNAKKTAVDFIFPLKGERPYAVMIDNEGTRPLPQGGLDKAQIIYEMLAEGGVTRLMPMFWGTNPTMIGPVRSSRHYFLDYAMEHDAIYVHFGWSPMARQDIAAFNINNINGVANGGEIFWDLTKNRNNWQDSYTSMKRILDYVNRVHYRTATEKDLVFSYNQDTSGITDGRKAEKIGIRYNKYYSCGFTYDSSTGTYKRFRKDKPHMERVTNKQLRAQNIIIQKVENYTIDGDDKGRQEFGNVGRGDGWFITGGKAAKIKWSKATRKAPTEYVYEDGTRVMLNPGQTWIQLVPSSSKVTIE